ncbi:hypothetical protein ECG_05283 [Echinococcus granulosus]|uniref:Expressed protein n=1 Tax=Echinococcus granulosus TaxID=6210 RepID=A0A068WEM0_ECHGR|nr:hypothetical protein ECG_05283 [Echinococcus granulosus]CDS18191.1 expressed protein [Echinococcus granulosus]
MNGKSREEIDKMRAFFKETKSPSNNYLFIDAIDFAEWTAKIDNIDPEDLKVLYATAMFLIDQGKSPVQLGH